MDHNNRQKHDLTQKVHNTLRRYEMVRPDDTILIGASGGPDSTALIDVLSALADRLSFRIGIAHLDHSIRNVESNRDARFVADLAQRRGLPFFTAREDVLDYKRKNKISLEEAARRVRYDYLEKVARENGYHRIALGHHRDDNAEQVLMALIRGSGPLGLSGIPPIRTVGGGNITIIRPLISVWRSDIITYLRLNRIEYRHDHSNQNEAHLRNRIRHQLIPLLRNDYNPNISETVNRLSDVIRAEDRWMAAAVEPVYESIVISRRKGEMVLSAHGLADLSSALSRRIIRNSIAEVKGNLRRIGYTHIDAVSRLAESLRHIARLNLPHGICIEKAGDRIHIWNGSRETVPTAVTSFPDYEFKIDPPGSVFIDATGDRLRFSLLNRNSLPDLRGTGQNTAFFDRDTLSFPLMVRNFRKGDRFIPLGMRGTQKLKDFFINRKVPAASRRQCPLVLSEEKIIWVGGHRIGEAAKVTDSTRKVLKAELLLA
jgi:tRNA(Ile)-lysidine synthase